jgi:hypothetical protein
MATDSAGHVHLVLVGYPGNAQVMSLLHSEWDGNDWLAPTTITNSPPYPEYPRIAIGKGNVLNVVWFAGDRAGIDRVPIGVWYSTARTSAPQVTSRAASGQGLAVTSVLATPTPAGSVQTSRTQQPRPALGGTEVFDNSDPDSGWLATVRGHPDFAIAVGAGAALLAIAIGLAIGSGLWRLLPVSQKHRS